MKTIGCAAIALLLAGPTLAAEPVSDAVRNCMAQSDSLLRANCYDRLYGTTAVPAAAAAPASAPAAAATAAAVGATAATAASLGDESLSKNRAAKAAAVPTSLTANVAEVKEIKALTYRLTLDNGQVWMQEEMKSSFRIGVGDTVQIERGKIGGYSLARVQNGKPTGTWIRVTRHE